MLGSRTVKALSFMFFPKRFINSKHGKALHRLWAIMVKRRDNKVCRRCHATQELQAHHIKPKALFPRLAYKLWNGITLCRRCHKEYHHIYGYECRGGETEFLKWLLKGVNKWN